jgi:cation diffusion facilitator family transporter
VLDPVANARARRRAGLVSLLVGIALFGAKLLAWLVTHSTAVFSDAMESVVNVVAAALLVWSLRVARRPADADHPYGHGKIEYFSAGIEGTLIAVAAVLIGVEAMDHLLSGAGPRRIGFGLALVVASALANAGLGVYLRRVGQRTRSLALAADGRHVLTDVWTSAGVVVGLAAVHLTGLRFLDPLVALGVAARLLVEGGRLARDATRGLMDASDEDLLAEICASLEEGRRDHWIDVHGLRAWRAGAAVHVDLHLVVPRYFDAERLHRIHDAVTGAALSHAGGEGDAIVHFDPCKPYHCRRCPVVDCPVRSRGFERRIPVRPAQATRQEPLEGLLDAADAAS